MTVPVSFTGDDDGYYDNDDNRNGGKVTIEVLFSRQEVKTLRNYNPVLWLRLSVERCVQ